MLPNKLPGEFSILAISDLDVKDTFSFSNSLQAITHVTNDESQTLEKLIVENVDSLTGLYNIDEELNLQKRATLTNLQKVFGCFYKFFQKAFMFNKFILIFILKLVAK